MLETNTENLLHANKDVATVTGSVIDSLLQCENIVLYSKDGTILEDMQTQTAVVEYLNVSLKDYIQFTEFGMVWLLFDTGAIKLSASLELAVPHYLEMMLDDYRDSVFTDAGVSAIPDRMIQAELSKYTSNYARNLVEHTELCITRHPFGLVLNINL
jgi:hypothetical protein